MKRFFKLFLSLSILLPIIAFAATTKASNQFVEGTDYKLVKPNMSTVTNIIPAGKVQVIEFFSYGCPWCFQLEPYVEKWLAKKPANVDFQRIPVVFESGWDTYAKAYYIAKALNVEDKLTPAIFNAIQKQNKNLLSDSQMAAFFALQGVDAQTAINAFQGSPTISIELQNGDKLMQAYSVFEIPTFIVDGKYRTNAAMAGGDNARLIKILNFLIAKAAKS